MRSKVKGFDGILTSRNWVNFLIYISKCFIISFLNVHYRYGNAGERDQKESAVAFEFTPPRGVEGPVASLEQGPVV